jgi:hypothetical protein
MEFANASQDTEEMPTDSVNPTLNVQPTAASTSTQDVAHVMLDLCLKELNVYRKSNVFKTVTQRTVFAIAMMVLS